MHDLNLEIDGCDKSDTIPNNIKIYCDGEETIVGDFFIPRGVPIHDHLCENHEQMTEIIISKAEIKESLYENFHINATVIFLDTCKYIEVNEEVNLIPDMKKLKKVKIFFKDKSFLIGLIYVPSQVRRLSDLIRGKNKNFLLLHTEENFGRNIHYYVFVGTHGHQVKRIDFLGNTKKENNCKPRQWRGLNFFKK